MEFLNIPLFDDDFFKLAFRFFINISFLIAIIWHQYYKTTKRKDFMFTFFMVGTLVFFLCFTLKKFELDIGMALGLFAIFGIIRYRTDSIDIKEMTYLFVVIGVSVINALANTKMSYAEIFATNFVILGFISVLNNLHIIQNDSHKEVLYELIENIKPENKDSLIQDLENRLGLKVNRVDVKEVDFLKDVAKLNVYYSEKA